MKREALEERYLDHLARGVDPLDDPDIRRAIDDDPELARELDALRGVVDRLGELEAPEWDGERHIDYMTRAFEEGFRQGRMMALERRSAPDWLRPLRRFAAVAATVVVVVGAVFTWTARESEMSQLRADMHGLQELVAVSLLENESASQRLRGLQWSRIVDQPGDRLLAELSATLRGDENVDVRLAAADVMRRYVDRPEVRRALYESVLSDGHPLVQVQIIDVFTLSQDEHASPVLRELVSRPEVSDVVRTKASEALTELGKF